MSVLWGQMPHNGRDLDCKCHGLAQGRGNLALRLPDRNSLRAPAPSRRSVGISRHACHVPPHLRERLVDCHEEESEPGSTRARPDTFLLAVDVSPPVQTASPRFATPNCQSTRLVKVTNGAVKTAVLVSDWPRIPE
jgi:hypothetical protein